MVTSLVMLESYKKGKRTYVNPSQREAGIHEIQQKEKDGDGDAPSLDPK
jgi:hypothetical protein